MSWRAPIVLPPSAADCAVSRFCLRHASPALERTVGLTTWLADEKTVLAAAAVFWIASHWGRPKAERHEADRMLGSVILAGVMPHLFKYLVRRERPNRTLIKRARHGVPRLGDAYDSFPSGHAVHLGAIAGSLARLLPRGPGVPHVSRLGVARRQPGRAAGALSERRPRRLGNRHPAQQDDRTAPAALRKMINGGD
jgi:hypothetical protein